MKGFAMKNGKYTEAEVASFKRRTDAFIAHAREMPGFDETLSEVRAEQEASELIADLARRTHLSQRQIARRMRVSQPRISQITASRDLSLSTIIRFAAAAGLKLTFKVASAPRDFYDVSPMSALSVNESVPSYSAGRKRTH